MTSCLPKRHNGSTAKQVLKFNGVAYSAERSEIVLLEPAQDKWELGSSLHQSCTAPRANQAMKVRRESSRLSRFACHRKRSSANPHSRMGYGSLILRYNSFCGRVVGSTLSRERCCHVVQQVLASFRQNCIVGRGTQFAALRCSKFCRFAKFEPRCRYRQKLGQ